MAKKEDIEIYSGDTVQLRTTIKDKTGTVVNLTGFSAKWAFAKNINDSAIVTKTIGDGIALTDTVNGILTVTINPDDTASRYGQHYHELQITDNTDNVSTVTYGVLHIKRDLIS